MYLAELICNTSARCFEGVPTAYVFMENQERLSFNHHQVHILIRLQIQTIALVGGG